MQPGSKDPRIEAMYRGDKLAAMIALAALWFTIVFVFIQILPNSESSGIVLALVIGGGLVLLFNTASIFAMTKHYAEDKDHIYGLDIHYLDEMKKRGRG